MRCKYCNSEKVVKKGFNPNKKQRYLCKSCDRTFVENTERNYYPHHYRELAVRMFCEGMTMMAIARVLKVPYQTVRTWIRREGEKALKKI